ncbi:hypothetical protein F2Q70_00045779 [Brassica cretica]|uniref:H(+)-exporting diphosphatase n=1 Tax=Brassica cretica TaxID=69181 RepID=A0A8S9KIV2_BRACR|nr:hypothetical protein F2Q70_00045779 [Brassica cretica]
MWIIDQKKVSPTSHTLCKTGVAVAALGMLSTIATDALDAAGNTTAAIGKTVDVLTPKVVIWLLVGAMLPYWFSAMTMKSVGSAALKMVEESEEAVQHHPGAHGRYCETRFMQHA